MKHLLIVSLFVLSVGLVVTSSDPAPPDVWAGVHPSIQVSVAPGGVDTYRVAATIRDLRNDTVLAEPVMMVTAGIPAQVEFGSVGAPEARLVVFRVTVAADGQSAACRAEFHVNDEIIVAVEATLAVGR